MTTTKGVFPLIRKAGECGVLNGGFSWIISAPTGSGKTHLSLLLAEEEINKGNRVLFLTPLRAQGFELFDKWNNIITDAQLYLGQMKWEPKHDEASLLITTPESAFRLMVTLRKKIFSLFSLIIIDEIHLLESSHRGEILEYFISVVKRLNPFCRFLTLSGTISKDLSLINFMDSSFIVDKFRPVPLKISTIAYNNFEQKIDIVKSMSKPGKTTLIFVHGRKRAEEISKLLNKDFNSSFHHAGLSKDEQKVVEKNIINRKLDFIVATPTLEMGLNLPVANVIIFDLYYNFGDQWSFITKRSLFQRVGRAGRPGLDDMGRGVILHSKRDKKIFGIINSNYKPLKSTISNTKSIENFILREITYNFSNTINQLQRSWTTTLAQHQIEKPKFLNIVNKLESVNLIYKNNNGTLKADRLTSIAVKSMIDPTFFAWAIKQISFDLTVFDYLLLASFSTLSLNFPLYFEDLSLMTVLLENISSKIISNFIQNENFSIFSSREFLKALKTAIILFYQSDILFIKEIEKFNISSELKMRIKTQSLLFISKIESFIFRKNGKILIKKKDHPAIKLKINSTKGMILGFSKDSAPLMILKGIGPKRITRLIENSLGSLDIIKKSNLSSIIAAKIPKKIAKNAISEANFWSDFIEESSFFFDINKSLFSKIEDPYRLKRARSLKVIIKDSSYLVVGGMEPHTVKNGVCDCKDFKAGNYCKHMIATDIYNHKESKSTKEQSLGKLNLILWWMKS